MKMQKQIYIELLRRKAARPIDVVQYDTGIQLVFAVQDFDIPSGTSATLYVQKPSGKFVYQGNDISIIDNVVTVNLHNQALTEYGRAGYQLRLENGGDLISTFAGIMQVEKSLADSTAMESETVVSAFGKANAEMIALAQAEITAMGELVKASIPNEYTETSHNAETAMKTKADAIVCEASGELIKVSDASNMPLQGLRIFGKTAQLTTTGKNILPFPYLGTTQTSNGVTYTVNNDGTISVSGTATGYSCLVLYHGDVPTGGEVTVSIGSDIVNMGLEMALKDSSNTALKSFDGVTSATFNAADYPTATVLYIALKRRSNATVSGTAYPQMEYGSTATEYEQYSGRVTSPSPEWPQEMVSVGNGGTVNVAVAGKNLFAPPASTYTSAGFKVDTSADGTVTINGTGTGSACIRQYDFAIPLPPGTYTLSANNVATAVNDTYSTYEDCVLMWVRRDDTNYMGTVYLTEANASTTFTTTHYLTQLRIRIGANIASLTNFVIKPQLERAGTASEHQIGYFETVALSTPNGLPGIPVASGGNYTDPDGQQWICDEIDLARGVYVKRIGNIIFDGTQNYHINAYQQTYNYFVFGCTKNGASMSDLPMLCDKLKYKPWGSFTVDDIGNYVCYEAYSFYIALADQTINTVDAFTAYLAANPITAHYILATPIETALTAEELAAYAALHSNKPNTTVFNDAGAIQSVEYAADTKIYIDNKFAELSAAMLASS